MSQKELINFVDRKKGKPIQNIIESAQFIQFRPVTAVKDSQTIEFNIQVGPDEYIDTENIYLLWNGKLVNGENGNPFSDTLGTENNYAMINYGLNTAFEQLSIYLGTTLISQSSKNYPYLSYIELITNSKNKYFSNTSQACPSPNGFYSH